MLILKDLKYDIVGGRYGARPSTACTWTQRSTYGRNGTCACQEAFQRGAGAAAREKAMEGEVIVTTGGMLDGGPVIRYLQQERDNPKSSVLMTVLPGGRFQRTQV